MPKEKPIVRPPTWLRPTNTLPPGYKQRGTFAIDLSTIRGLIRWNLIGAFFFFLLGWAFLASALYLRPELSEGILQASQQVFFTIVANLIAMAAAILLHEMVHGLLFWAYTRTPPIFGFRLAYAYAAAPGWYLPRGQFIIVALAPLVFLTLIGYGLIAVIPPIFALPLLFGMATNAAGTIGDVAVVIWLLLQSHRILIEDLGDSIRVYWA